ncbi:MAG: AAA family ATPase [Gemmatimonadaceae bacterium]
MRVPVRRGPPPTDEHAILADDFAPQLNPAELAELTTAVAALRPVVVISAMPARMPALRQQMEQRRIDVIMRELALLVRRNLRGSDAVSLEDDELLVLLDAPSMMAAPVGARLLAAVRAHHFLGGALDQRVRLSLSIGASAAPEHGSDFASLASAARTARSAAGADRVALARAPRADRLDLERFVGRAEPIEQMTDYLDDMVRGVARVVAVIGESGVGSSALVRTLGPEVRLRGGSLVIAACYKQRLPEPYALWGEVLRAVRRLPVKSTRLWRELASLDATLERASDDLTRGGSKVRLLEELADFLRLAAQQRPLLFLLDDMQWADDASWEALEYLIPHLESERIVLALTLRVGERSDDALERWSRLRSRPRHEELRLTRLTRDDVKRWVEGAMSSGEAGRDLLAYLYRHTEGNPLHIAHLLRDLEESGHLVREGDRWRWSAIRDLPPPSAFHVLVARRVSRLPADCRSLLALAATLGREFDEALLQRAGGWSAEEARTHTNRLIDACILTPTYDRACASFQFSHDEVARAVRAHQSSVEQAQLHAKAAVALTERGSASDAVVAAHFEAAGRNRDAHLYAVRAADAALALYDNAAAAALLTSAARHAPSPAALATVRVRLAALAEEAGRYEEAEALCDLALNWFDGGNDRLEAIRLKRRRTLVRMKRGQTARETLETLFALLSEAAEAGADAERAAILLVSSQMLARLGEPREAQRVAEECVEIAQRCNDPVLLSDSYNRLGLCLLLSDGSRARGLFTHALRLIVPLSDVLRRVRLLNNIGILEQTENRWNEARQSLTASAEFARVAGLTELWARASVNLGVLEMRVGDHEAALASLNEALRLSAEAQHTELQVVTTYNLANLAREKGEYERGGEVYELAMELAERIGQSEVHAGALAGMALCRLALDDEAQAIVLYERLRPLVPAESAWFQGREYVEALPIRLALRRGGEGAEDLFKAALALADTGSGYGAAWLTAEFGLELREHAPEVIDAALQRYRSRPEVLDNPYIRERFGVLMGASMKTVDRNGK